MPQIDTEDEEDEMVAYWRGLYEKEKDKSEWEVLLIAAPIFLTIGVMIWMTMSYFEARAYNNVTGKAVSLFDAMFLELRIQEGTK